jgi:hypothetical protein
MNDRERREFEMALEALMVLTRYQSYFDGIAAIAAAIDVLQTETDALRDLGVEKVSATGDARDKTIYKGDLRDALDDAMQDIADMWKPMAKNYENAQNKFRMPRGGSDQLRIDTAGVFIQDATELKEAFTGRGMPGDFIIKLTAKRDAFDTVVNESDEARLERIGVNAEFREPLRKCREAVEDVDPIVKMVFRDDAAKLAEWMSASRVKKA